MPNSMTGFARKEHQAPWGVISCEIRSVNHRYLEPLIRLPDSLRVLETTIRDLCRQQLQRGKVEISVQFVPATGQAENLSMNTVVVQQLLKTIEQARQLSSAPLAELDPVRLLQWPGVLEQADVDAQLVESQAQGVVEQTLQALLAHRQREGVELSVHIEQRLTAIAEIVNQVQQAMPEILLAQQEKLQQRLQGLDVELDEDRFAQEVALLINKADVAEELDRLTTHLTEVRHILQQSGAIGRRLDFMMQELNREANTLSSKSIHTQTTQAAVSLKVLIEQMREQIQNIE